MKNSVILFTNNGMGKADENYSNYCSASILNCCYKMKVCRPRLVFIRMV
jgi:hypothetical protein